MSMYEEWDLEAAAAWFNSQGLAYVPQVHLAAFVERVSADGWGYSAEWESGWNVWRVERTQQEKRS